MKWRSIFQLGSIDELKKEMTLAAPSEKESLAERVATEGRTARHHPLRRAGKVMTSVFTALLQIR